MISCQQSERRAFGLHPAILLTLMREQAGSLDKAMAELVMNSVDAGASRIDISISKEKFSISDDGKGFTQRDQIENLFEIFGTPHHDGDAYYAKFRIGRGQIMSYASTNWRSGPFEMRVDIAGSDSDLGYELITHDDVVPGCRIDGVFYKDTYVNIHAFVPLPHEMQYYERTFLDIVQYVPIPIYVNGAVVNKPPTTVGWDMEDEFAWYRFSKDFYSARIFNRGVLVEERSVKEFGVGCNIVSKQPLQVNLARNAIDSRCPIWQGIATAVRARFEIHLAKARKLGPEETAALLCELFKPDVRVTGERLANLRKLRFIPDVFGKLQSPEEFLGVGRFTLFDGEHQMVAERVQRQGLASVFVGSLFQFTDWKRNDDNFFLLVKHLWEKLDYRGSPEWIPFNKYVEELSDTCQVLDDSELLPEELLALECLRDVNEDLARSVCGHKTDRARRLVAGASDSLGGWTDGSTYVAIDRKQLQSIRGGSVYGIGPWRNSSKSWNYGPTKLIALLAHEYAHTDSSVGNHGHDLAFYQRFHESVFRPGFGGLADEVLRKYISGLAKIQVRVSGPVRKLIEHVVAFEPKLKPKAVRSRR